MKKTLLLLCASALCISVTAQEQLKNKVLFTVENDTIKAEEFMAVYNKNREIGEEIDPKTPSEYLDLYINFKLKVHEAKELGRDTLNSFLREFRNYREQLAKPYLSDKDVTEELIKEAYVRMKSDVRASHIMISLPKNPSADDTTVALEEILEIKIRIKNGESFEALARELSDDTYSAKNGGDLGFFTVFDMVYPFETAAYKTPVGKVSEPVRSQYGYHIVMPTAKREARGKIRVAHLMLIDNDKTTAAEKATVKNRIDEIYGKLQAGEDFVTLVKQYSDDKTSVVRDGELDIFGINRMYSEFEDAAFALEKAGDYTQPVKTPIGWHIIYLIEKIGIPSFQETQKEIKNKVERDVRAQQSQVSVMKRIKQSYKFKEYPKNFKLAFKQIGEELFTGGYEVPAKLKSGDKVLFEFANKQYTVSDFLNYAHDNQAAYARSTKLEPTLYRMMKTYQESELISYEKSRLSIKFPEFRLLEREYYEGILLFDLTEQKVWRKAMADTSGLQNFFEETRSNYTWDTRYHAYLVDGATKKLTKKATKLLRKGRSRSEVMAELNVESKLNLNIDSGHYELKDLDLAEALSEMDEPGRSDLIEVNGRFKQAYVLEIEAPRNKELKETRGAVISAYQQYLEKEWISDLKSRYQVTVDSTVLKEIEQALD